MVIITASRRIVRLLVIFGVSISIGKTPEKFVIRDNTRAAPIMKALLIKSFNARPMLRQASESYMKYSSDR
jgi:hypothetical protein